MCQNKARLGAWSTKKKNGTEQSCLHKLLALACQGEARRLPTILLISQQARYNGIRRNKYLYLSIHVSIYIDTDRLDIDIFVRAYTHISPIRGEICYFSSPHNVLNG